MSPAVSPSPQGQSQSQSPSGQSPSPSGVSPSPLDQSPSPLDPSPSLTKVRVSPDLVWTHESSSRKVHYFNPTFNNFCQMASYIDYNFGPKLNRLVYRNVSLFLGKLE